MYGIGWLLVFIIAGIVWPFARLLWWLMGLLSLALFWKKTQRLPRVWILGLAVLALWPLKLSTFVTGPLIVKEVRSQGVYAVEKGIRPRAVYVRQEGEGWDIGDVIMLNKPLQPREMALSSYRLLKSGEPVVLNLNAHEVQQTKGRASLWVRVRQSLDERIKTRFPVASCETVRAMVTGMGSKGERYELLQRFGLVHVLAISGLHVALLYGVLRKLLDVTRLRYGTKLAVSLAGLWAYALMVGMGPSVARAALMLTFVVLAEFAPWPVFKWEGLALAACLLLLYRPLWLFHPGFLLSFACMWAILVIYPALRRRRVGEERKSLKDAGCFLGAIFLVTWPLQMRFFGYVSLWSWFANLVMLPIYTFSLIASWLAIGLPGVLGSAAAHMVTYALVGADTVMEWLYALWGGQIFGSTWGVEEILLYELLVYVMTVERTRIVYRPAMVKLAAGALLIPVLIGAFYPMSSELRVHYLDVGQGDAILVQYQKHGLLIDTGGAKYEDVGRCVTVPEIRRVGVRALDGIFISHWDLDHGGALRDVLRQFSPGGLYASYLDEEAMAEMELDVSVESLSSWRMLQRGDEIRWRDIALEVLWPQQEGQFTGNEASMVLRLRTPHRSYLFTGDLEKEAERQLASLGGIEAQVLKVGHHGSRFSSGRIFLEEVKPEVAVISCGKYNAYGHPHEETLERLQACGAVIYRTDQQGTVSLVDGEMLSVEDKNMAASYGLLAYMTETGLLFAFMYDQTKERERGFYRL